MSVDDSREILLRLRVDDALILQMHVEKRMALSAEKMGMGFHVAVETVRSVGGDFHNFSKLSQEGKIAVHGSQADIRKFLPHMQINRIRGGVVVPGEQEPFDGLPLTAVF